MTPPSGSARSTRMGPHNREIPLAALKKGHPRSKAGKPGTHAYKGKSR